MDLGPPGTGTSTFFLFLSYLLSLPILSRQVSQEREGKNYRQCRYLATLFTFLHHLWLKTQEICVTSSLTLADLCGWAFGKIMESL